ncbi:DNA-directed RNA polymerase III subunit RPC10, partial [Kickxella alabastrina]
EEWANVDSIEISCPKCLHERAYFKQIQMRSADEPMTVFFRCCSTSCNFNWKEN